MKKNVKIVSILVICILLCGVMMACGPKAEEKVSEPAVAADGGDAVVADAAAGDAASAEGKWSIDSVTDENGTVAGADIVAETGEIYYDFQAGGKFIAGAGGITAEGTWEQTGSEVKFTINGVTAAGTMDGDTLSVVSNGATSVFARA